MFKKFFLAKKRPSLELPAGAAKPAQPQKPQVPIKPNKKILSTSQVNASAAGKQLLPTPKPPKTQSVGIKAPGGKKAVIKPNVKSPTPLKTVTKNQFFLAVPIFKKNLQSACQHCNKPQFTKEYIFDPCACFLIEKYSKRPFVRLIKNNGTFSLVFRKNADPESVIAFLRTLKFSLKVTKAVLKNAHKKGN